MRTPSTPHGLKRSFGRGEAKITAVNGIDLTVEPGTTTMIVGPSGCGKTTLLSLIAGVLDPDEGDVSVFGTRWDELSDKDRVRARGRLIGFVFQGFNLVPTLSALQNASVPALLRGLTRAESESRARDALASVGLGDRTGAMPSQLSGGMLQRVAIARALVADPFLLVCDEPTANLDAETGAMIMNELTKLPDQEVADGRRRAVLAVTHDQRIFGYADVIHEMEDGRLTGERRPERDGEVANGDDKSHEDDGGTAS